MCFYRGDSIEYTHYTIFNIKRKQQSFYDVPRGYLTVNDVSDPVSSRLLLYDGDSSILVADKSVSNMEHSLQKELEVFRERLHDNRHSLHDILFGFGPW